MVFQLVSRRYERGTMIITSNKSFTEWAGVLGDDVLATAILDRLLHHCDVININGQLPTQRPPHRRLRR
jgi:DNA replication protein DnaC